ncbi:MAG: glycoside hydrolase family 3 C-terminal domain-containing protein [Prolixibacteraceae bacterium]
MKRSFLLLCFLLNVCFLFAQISRQYPFNDSSLSLDERIKDLLGRLTLEEKVSQMMNQTPAIERLGIPPYDWWNEALHGVARSGLATVFPQAIALAATFDDQAVYETFGMVSDEARAKYHDYQRKKEYGRYTGLTFWTPNINIFRDPRWGRGMETYGEDPYLTGRMGVAVVRGLQGENPNYFKSLACAKHYAVHSGPEWNRHEYDARVSARDLRETYLPAFESLVKEGNVQQVMCAYNRFDGAPCCGNKILLNDILRNEWGYDAVVVSDCGAIDDFWRDGAHQTHPDATYASVSAVRAGTDLECGQSYTAILEAVKAGRILEDELDESLYRLFKGRFKLGMFDSDALVPWSKIPYEAVDCEKHKQKALEMARKSVVLLKNANHALPLSKSIRKIAVIGPNANDSVMLWANYNGFPSKTITILQGIQNKLPNTRVIYDKGCELVGDSISEIGFDNTVQKIRDADVLIFAGGISPSLEGEEMSVKVDGFRQGDRTNLELPATQQRLLRELKKLNKPLIYVQCSGSALAINLAEEQADAIVQAWYGGQAAGTAVADVLFGDYNPAGRSPVTFYKSAGQLPDFEDYSMKGRTYRYLQEKPLYPFGYGLSYTSFQYSDVSLSRNSMRAGETVDLHVSLRNTGKMDGDEVVQVYVKNKADKDGPVKTLRAFRRVHVKADSTSDLCISLPSKTFEWYNESKERMDVLPGKYIIYVGSSSAGNDLTQLSFTIH